MPNSSPEDDENPLIEEVKAFLAEMKSSPSSFGTSNSVPVPDYPLREQIADFLAQKRQSSQLTENQVRAETEDILIFDDETRKLLEGLNCYFIILRGQTGLDYLKLVRKTESPRFAVKLAEGVAICSGLRRPSPKSEVAIFADPEAFAPQARVNRPYLDQQRHLMGEQQRWADQIPGARLVEMGVGDALWVHYWTTIARNSPLINYDLSHPGLHTSTPFDERSNLMVTKFSPDNLLTIEPVINGLGRPMVSLAGMFIPNQSRT